MAASTTIVRAGDKSHKFSWDLINQANPSQSSSDIFVDVCASVESTLAGVDAVSGPVVIYLLMCVLVLNQH